ncbi:MAG TPA: hypothetical protein VF599_05905 [Pyrinomonadaceae bacterium]
MNIRLFQASLFAFLMAFFAVTQSIAQQIPQIPGMPPTAIENQPAQSPQPASPTSKKEGVKRIGVVLPKAQMTQAAQTGQDASEAIKQTIIAYLSGPSLDVVPLTGRIPAQIIAEAKEKQCDYILFTSVTQKKGSGGFGGLMKMAGPMMSAIPNMGAIGGSGAGGAMAGAVTQTIASAATQAAAQHDTSQQMANVSGNNIKAKDEITIEYKLVTAAENALVVTNTLKQKAKQNGEDVISPLVEQLANTVLETATQNK